MKADNSRRNKYIIGKKCKKYGRYTYKAIKLYFVLMLSRSNKVEANGDIH